jgi:RNA polymerase sigma-70 factor (ECF subfamily)
MADTDALSDAVCVEQARRGDSAAFDVLVRRYFRAAYAVALAVVGNRLDAEDVCQDAFVRAAERLDDCREPSKFAPWLLRITRNRACNLRDYRRVRSTFPLDEAVAMSPVGADQAVERSELRANLESALATLTDVQREVVLLHDLEGWTHKMIADALGTSEGMSRQHLFIARRLLRARLARYAWGEYSHE